MKVACIWQALSAMGPTACRTQMTSSRRATTHMPSILRSGLSACLWPRLCATSFQSLTNSSPPASAHCQMGILRCTESGTLACALLLGREEPVVLLSAAHIVLPLRMPCICGSSSQFASPSCMLDWMSSCYTPACNIAASFAATHSRHVIALQHVQTTTRACIVLGSSHSQFTPPACCLPCSKARQLLQHD